MFIGALPVHDWQFWVVTLAAALAGAWLLRSLARVVMPRRFGRGSARRTTLTVGGKPVSRSGNARRPRA